MTLVLTEVSNAGIAMASDSAITYVDKKTGRREIDKKGWSKLLRVPSIKAAVSYWGVIGAVTQNARFDTWLKKVIDAESYQDLPSFADTLAQALNKKCGGKPLNADQNVGVHVAGYHEWTDGIKRPMFFHVHNGHGWTRIVEEKAQVDDQTHIVAVYPKWQGEKVRLFAKHQDFPADNKSIEENLDLLKCGYLTRNGDYLFYSIVSQILQDAFSYFNLVPGVSIPRDPNNLGSRKGYLHMMLDIMVRIYGCSSIGSIIGGEVTSLGIRPNGTYLS